MNQFSTEFLWVRSAEFICISWFANTLCMIIPWCCRSYPTACDDKLSQLEACLWISRNSFSTFLFLFSSFCLRWNPRRPTWCSSKFEALVFCISAPPYLAFYSPHGFHIWCCCSNPCPQFGWLHHFDLDYTIWISLAKLSTGLDTFYSLKQMNGPFFQFPNDFLIDIGSTIHFEIFIILHSFLIPPFLFPCLRVFWLSHVVTWARRRPAVRPARWRASAARTIPRKRSDWWSGGFLSRYPKSTHGDLDNPMTEETSKCGKSTATRSFHCDFYDTSCVFLNQLSKLFMSYMMSELV